MDLYIVTGASRGLGRAIVERLAAERDVHVVAISRAGIGTAAAWRDVRADLGSPDGQHAATAAIDDALAAHRWSRAVLINNAGTIDPLGVVGAVDAAALRRNIEVNLTAPIVLMNAFIGGSSSIAVRAIVNISSGASRNPIAGSAPYCAAKAGLDMVSRVAQVEAERTGARLRITSLAPGIVDTDMQVTARTTDDRQFPDAPRFRAFKSENLLKTADEVAARIVALERAGRLPAGVADLREL